jgi:hypothetical protein
VALEQLTPEQERLLGVVREEWLRVGLSTRPADRAAAEQGVRLAYQAAGLPAPGRVVWLDSPLAGCIGAWMLTQVRYELDSQPWDQVWEQVEEQVWVQVWEQVEDRLWDQILGPALDQLGEEFGDQLGDGQVDDQVQRQVRRKVLGQLGGQVWVQVWEQAEEQIRVYIEEQVRVRVAEQNPGSVREQVREQVREEVWEQVWEQVEGGVWHQVQRQVREQVEGQVVDQVREQVEGQVVDQVTSPVLGQLERAVYGQHDAAWLSHYSYFAQAAPDLAGPERLQGHMHAAQACGWWWPFHDAVILTERPRVLHRDPAGRLHCPHGPALAYPDGFAVWAWHGVRVPADMIDHPEALTIERIRAERNVEVRRVMLERYGQARYLRDAGAKQVHADHTGVLWRCEIPGEEPLVMVEVRDSTLAPDGSRRAYWLQVPPGTRTARQAVAWTFGLGEDEYAPTVES